LQTGDAIEDGHAERRGLLLLQEPCLEPGNLGLECLVACREVFDLPPRVKQFP
jgi:hypothetical protein